MLIAGGHVAVLRNRMLFFGIEHALQAHAGPVLAWGAGAMALTERIVLFYDDAPFGPAEAEVLDHGLGLAEDLVLFPHAKERLRLDERERVGALARRFGPAPCVSLEKGAIVEREGDRWVSRGASGTASILGPDGAVLPMEAP